MSLNRHKPLYQPWSEEEFSSDLSVRAMTPVQRWIYRSLLQAMFFCATRPYLPDNDNLLWMIAGCESKQQWADNKKVILQNFTKLYKDERKLLSQKRIEIDFNREVEYRAKLSERQRDKANARWEKERGESGCPGNAAAMPNDATEPNRTEHTEPNRTERKAGMTYKDKIIDTALEVLGTTVRSQDRGWDDLKPLIRLYKQDAVVDAFQDWAETRKGSPSAYPLSEFAKIAPGLLRGVTSVKANPKLKGLIDDLMFIANDARVTFDHSQTLAVGKLLPEHDPEDIKAAFREFLDPIFNDDFWLKKAARTFSETAEQLLTLRKRRKAEALRQESVLQAAKAQSIAEAIVQKMDEEPAVEETL